ncbi:MAG: hypothetical protein JWN03_8415 [Nocardia sp.]|uniref:acyltransferase n=1 Tax=Nocardia sp. TaxID=1821 RepID=UPI002610D01A|nr:hypothetical protein [Nocardia sp.]MCU1648140.1 hypothetical protein [Nocardia sp.]
MRTLSGLIQALLWLLPASAAKNAGLRRFGHHIGNNVRLGPSLVWSCRRFVIADAVTISTGNVFRGMSEIRLGHEVMIGSWNWISAHPGYQQYSELAGRLNIGDGSFITSRHYLDCSGTIEIGEWSAVGGQRSTLQTHEIDVVTNETTVGRVRIGNRSLVATGCILLRGSSLPDRSLLAAGSTLTRAKSEVPPSQGLWGGVPARFIRPMQGEWFDRTEIHTDVVPFETL